MKIVVDTSILIDFSRTGTGLFKDLIKGANKRELELYISSVTIVEFWAGKSMENKIRATQAEKIFSRMIQISLDEKIAKTAGKLIRRGVAIGFDSVIAATALEIGAQVVTSNVKHFSKIKNLKLWKSTR